MKNLFVPLTNSSRRECEIEDCENDASWICHPQGCLAMKIHVCTSCKRDVEQGAEHRKSPRYVRYHLPGILSDNQVVVVDRHGALVLLGPLDERCTILEQQTFTNQEMLVLLELLESYPLRHCSYELLLARMTGERIEACRLAIIAAQCVGDQALLQSLRSLLSGCESRLRRFGIGIVTIFETGYALAPLTVLEGEEHNEEGGGGE
jgi:hypothetical protein